MSNHAVILSLFWLERWSIRYRVILGSGNTAEPHGTLIQSTKSGLRGRTRLSSSFHWQRACLLCRFSCQRWGDLIRELRPPQLQTMPYVIYSCLPCKDLNKFEAPELAITERSSVTSELQQWMSKYHTWTGKKKAEQSIGTHTRPQDISVHNQELSISSLFLHQISLLFFFFFWCYGTISRSVSSHQQLYSFAVKLSITKCANFMWYPTQRKTVSETKYNHDWHYSSLRINVWALVKMPSRSTNTHMSIFGNKSKNDNTSQMLSSFTSKYFFKHWVTFAFSEKQQNP